MAAVSITLFREKTVIVGDNQGREECLATIKSNRLLLPLGNRMRRENIVLRTRLMQDALRLSSLIIGEARRSATLLDRETPIDWQHLWRNANLLHGARPSRENWAMVFANGKPLLMPSSCPHIELVERLAASNGGHIDEVVLKTAASEIGSEDRDVRIEHASKAAVVATLDEKGYRCAIQVRNRNSESAFTFQIPDKEKGISFGAVLEQAAHYIEGHRATVFLDQVQSMVNARQVASANISASEVEAVMIRRSKLKKMISSFEQDAQVRYRPERPKFLVA